MQSRPRRPQFSSRPEGSGPNVTSAIGMEETFGRSRARRTSLFTRTIMWVTGLICAALLLATFAQAWSNHHLIAQVQQEQQTLQQVRTQHSRLSQDARHYQNPAVVENEARQQFGYIRPGEHAVVIIDANNKGQQKIKPTPAPPPQQGHWQDWWKVFFGSTP
ncbi:septum formation initiator family protein [Dictyobacter aurantiacus]|uniref:Septum formation initiator n=1 Tax=Dictyobacter aurantiacus TaxID=1936993 RepID=A0A401ZE99_9CHLR|nr:septum formation initiator family protein [Dictyobacter aurantiacus]GCE05201.1 hypothetical protein KDAU_25300 [Dictyobacter aurantiacus]